MFHLEISASVGKEFAAAMRPRIIKARALLDCELRELSIALVNDRTMIRLHDEYMNDASPTDVLTFTLDTNGAREVTAGEVVICVPEARRAARSHRTRVEDELLLYALHGMLHLCGLNDKTDAGFRRMHKMEDQILMQLGVGRVFDPARIRNANHRASEPRRRESRGVRL